MNAERTRNDLLKTTILLLLIFLSLSITYSQPPRPEFGSGINIASEDSSYTMRFGIRFQNLYSSNWDVHEDDLGRIGDHNSAFLIRRSRLKFNGYAFTPDLKYKIELGLSNRDIGGGINPEHGNAPRFILDAYVDWNFWQNLTLRVGQAKLPGNRERVISSANMQFVDRSRLNSRYNIDRDIGLQLFHHFTLGDDFLIREVASFSQGEGRDITVGNLGGYCYTFRLEALPFGKFASKGDYVGAAIVREDSPKLSLAATYDINDGSVRESGQLGSFIKDDDGNYYGKTLQTLFIDMMFKYSGLSIMGEYADKRTPDGDPFVYGAGNNNLLGTHFTGTGLNLQAGWMFENQWEIACRYSNVRPTEGVGPDEDEYTLGISRYIVGHKLKVQSDLSYREIDQQGSNAAGEGRDDLLTFRVQFDIHF